MLINLYALNIIPLMTLHWGEGAQELVTPLEFRKYWLNYFACKARNALVEREAQERLRRIEDNKAEETRQYRLAAENRKETTNE